MLYVDREMSVFVWLQRKASSFFRAFSELALH